MGSTQDHTATCGRLSWVLIPGLFSRCRMLVLQRGNRPGISSQPGSNWSGNSVGTVWVAGTPGYPETRSN